MKTPFRHLHWLCALTALLSFTVCSLAQSTAVLLNETFDSGIPSNWIANGGSQAAVNSSSDPASTLAGTGGALRHLTTQQSASNGTHYSNFAATTLAKAGDTITMSFNFRGTATAYQNNANNLFDFGLLGSTKGTFAIADTFGYGMSMRMEEQNRAAATEPVARVVNGTVLSSTTFTASSSTGSAYSLYGDNRLDIMSFTFSITRQADDGLLLTAVFANGTTKASFTRAYSVAAADLQNKASPYTFDTVFIGFQRAGTANTIFDIDNVLVTSSLGAIPEPSTIAALLGTASLLFVAGRRYRNR